MWTSIAGTIGTLLGLPISLGALILGILVYRRPAPVGPGDSRDPGVERAAPAAPAVMATPACPVDLATGGQDDRHSRSVKATLVVSTHNPSQQGSCAVG